MMGNCGVGIAPCKPEVREIAAWDLVNVEAIPFDVLSKGINVGMGNLSRIHGRGQRRGSGINLGFIAPLTPFRHYVMGEESMERAATADETAKIAGVDQRGGGGGRVRLHHHVAAAYRLPGPAAGLPQGEPRRVQGLRERR